MAYQKKICINFHLNLDTVILLEVILANNYFSVDFFNLQSKLFKVIKLERDNYDTNKQYSVYYATLDSQLERLLQSSLKRLQQSQGQRIFVISWYSFGIYSHQYIFDQWDCFLIISQINKVNKLMYEQLKRKIENERTNFEKQIQKISTIRSHSKPYSVYQKQRQQNHSTSAEKIRSTPIKQEKQQQKQSELLEDIKEKTRKSREQVMTNLTLELQSLKGENLRVNGKFQCVMTLLKEKESKIRILENQYRQKFEIQSEQNIKMEDEEKRLKELIRSLNIKLQDRQQKTTQLEEEQYETLIKLQKQQEKIHSLTGQRQFLIQKCEKLILSTEELQAEILLLKEKQAQKQNNTEKYDSIINNHNISMNAQSDEIKKLEELISELTRERNYLKKEIQVEKIDYSMKMEQQKEHRNQMVKKVQDFQENLYKSQSQNEELKKKVIQAATRIELLNSQVEQGKKELEDLQIKVFQKEQHLCQNISELEQKVSKQSADFKLKKVESYYLSAEKKSIEDSLLIKLSKVQKNQWWVKSEKGQFMRQLRELIREMKKYIESVGSMAKVDFITPTKIFRDRKAALTKKESLEKSNKKAYSEGQLREHQKEDPIVGNIYEHQGGYQVQEPKKAHKQNQVPEKYCPQKEPKNIEKYFEDHREMCSEISSVKNQSFISRDSFLNTKSELNNFEHYLIKNWGVQGEVKKQDQGFENVELMQIGELRDKYLKLKARFKVSEEKREILEQICRNYEHQENQYQKKIQKMTNEFNQSFGMMIKLSGEKFKKSVKKNLEQKKEDQKGPIQIQVSANELKQKYEKERLEGVVAEQTKKIAQYELANRSLFNKINQAKIKLVQDLQSIKYLIVEPLVQNLKKNRQQFADFMKTVKDQLPKNISSSTSVAPLMKKKGSSGSGIVEKKSQIQERIKILTTVATIFEIKNQIPEGQISYIELESVLKQGLQELKKKIGLQFLAVITEQLNSFINLQSSEDRRIRVDEIKQELTFYFDGSEKVSELHSSLKDLIKVMSRENSDAVSHLSMNSIEREKSRKMTQDDDMLDEVVSKLKQFEDIKSQRNQLWEINRQLNDEVDDLKQKISYKNTIIATSKVEIDRLKEFQSYKDIIALKDKEIESLHREQQQIEQEYAKLKFKNPKRPKIYYINH